MTHEQKTQFKDLIIKTYELKMEQPAPPEPMATFIVNAALKDLATEVGGIGIDQAEIMLNKLRDELKILSNHFHKELKALQELEKAMKMLGFTEVYQTLFNKFSQ